MIIIVVSLGVDSLDCNEGITFVQLGLHPGNSFLRCAKYVDLLWLGLCWAEG